VTSIKKLSDEFNEILTEPSRQQTSDQVLLAAEGIEHHNQHERIDITLQCMCARVVLPIRRHV